MPINLLSVLVAAAANFVLGFLWYGPLFGKIWMKLMKFSEKDLEEGKKKGMTKNFIMGFISTLIMVYILAYLMQALLYNSISQVIFLAFLTWLGFVGTVTFSSVLWEGKPFKLYILNNMYNLISLIIVGLILRLWI
ncbi:DUF1761 domain-containing protein [Candidatus Woesearchaeota archaeon]|nr:DUF1761 domain-containing protein [Candidatus Woesearchaeota archaeon]